MKNLTMNLSIDKMPTDREVIDICWQLESEMEGQLLTAENALRMVDEIRRRIADRIVITISTQEEE